MVWATCGEFTYLNGVLQCWRGFETPLLLALFFPSARIFGEVLGNISGVIQGTGASLRYPSSSSTCSADVSSANVGKPAFNSVLGLFLVFCAMCGIGLSVLMDVRV